MGGKSAEVISTGTAYFLIIISFIGAMIIPTFWLWVLVRIFKIEGTGILNSILTVVLCWVALIGLFYGAAKIDSFLKDPKLVIETMWLWRVLVSFVIFTVLIYFLLHTDYIRRAIIFSIMHTVGLYFWVSLLCRFLEANGALRVFWDVGTGKTR